MLTIKIAVVLAVLCLPSVLSTESIQCPDTTGRKIVCYYSSWAFYREGNGQFDTRFIDPKLCTHYIYAFAGINKDGKLFSLDNNVDFTYNQYANFTNLKAQNPCLKAMLSVGGWNEGSKKFSIMASTPQSRSAFVEDALRFLAYYKFDGLDLDWEYPGARGGIKEDKENLVALVKNLKERFDKWGFQLSLAAPFHHQLIEDGYLINEIAQYVDFISIMAYDYTPANSEVTGLISPFSAIKSSLEIWLSNGVPPEKLILGFASFARSFYLKNEEVNNIGAATNGTLGRAGRYTKEPGFLSFFEMEEFLKTGLLTSYKEDENWYAFLGNEWFTYDTVDTYKIKAEYAMNRNIGGVMLWSLDTDDFSGYDGTYFKVLKTLREVVLSKRS